MRKIEAFGGVQVTLVMGSGTVLLAADFGSQDGDEGDWNAMVKYITQAGYELTSDEPWDTLTDGRDLFLLEPAKVLV